MGRSARVLGRPRHTLEAADAHDRRRRRPGAVRVRQEPAAAPQHYAGAAVTRRVLAIGGILLLFVLAGLTVWAAWLVNTEAGLHFVLRRLETLSAVSITASGARGTLSGPLEFDTLVIDHEAVRIDARKLRLHPKLSNLLSRTISIASAEAGTLEVT